MAVSLSYQCYPLISKLWRSIFLSGFDGSLITFDPISTSNEALRCAVGLEVILCGLIGRLSIIQILVILIGGVTSFSFCEVINLVTTKARRQSYLLDAGGSIDIFLWAGVVALTIAYSNRRKYPDLKEKYRAIPENDNPMLALIGTAFLWVGFMFIGHAQPAFQTEMDLAPINTIFAMSASLLTTYMMSVWIHFRLGIYECILATISGGVIVGASSSIAENPVIALTLGACSGIITYLLIHFFFQRINVRWMVMTHEIFATFLVNGFFGGVASSVVLASYIGRSAQRDLFLASQTGKNSGAADCSYQVPQASCRLCTLGLL